MLMEGVCGACRQHYSAGRMSLAILGGEPLEQLQQWVLDLFGSLPAGDSPKPSFGHAGLPFKVPASSPQYC